MGKKLYVGNLSFKTTEGELSEYFAQAGAVESVKIITDSYSGQSRGFGFVEMSSDEEAQKAISMFNGKGFMERDLTVNEAKPQEKRERGGGGGGGGYGRDR
jgi:RNA recognition motif-containing protein